MTAFDDYLTARSIAPIGPVEAQADPGAKLAALERDLDLPAVPADLAARLAAVEAAEAERKAQVRNLELRHYTYRKATEAGLPPAIFEGFGLPDESAVDLKTSELLALTESARLNAVRNQLLTGHRPAGAGNERGPGPLTLAEHISAAEHRTR